MPLRPALHEGNGVVVVSAHGFRREHYIEEGRGKQILRTEFAALASGGAGDFSDLAVAWVSAAGICGASAGTRETAGKAVLNRGCGAR